MKLFVLCSLLAVVIAASSQQQQWRRTSEPFRGGHEYVYQYKSQIASGIGSLDQHSTQLLASNVHIHFESERVATLHLRDVKVGVRNDQITEPHRLQHTQSFEQKEIEGELLEKLQMPLRFSYADGLVESINFHENDHVWSKNIKRAVLNLLQLNMKRRSSTLQGLDFEEQQQQTSSMEDDNTKSSGIRMFTMPETTLEGYCQTVYTVNTESENEKQDFNVTKSINFNQCKKLAFLRYGPRVETPTYETQQQQLEKIEIDRQQQLDRSSVFRYQLSGTPEKFGLGRVEVISQYVYKLMNAESQQPMQTVIVGELVLRSEDKKSRDENIKVSGQEESLLYSTEWDHQEKRFFQYGDDEFSGKTSPFAHVQNKVNLIVKLIKHIAQNSWDQVNGISTQSSLRVQEAAELVRMCTVQELDHIMKELRETEEQGLFADILAVAGTRNTIHFMVKKTMDREITVPKAVQALRQLNGLFTVSTKQVDDILRLCKSEMAKHSSALRQSCWLSFGSMVSELCKESTLTMTKEAEEQCSRTEQEKYHNDMHAEYRQAETTYEKVLALKAIGNAGLHKSIHVLEEIINNQQENPIVRQQAIDALRRYRTQMPVKVQRILLPVFKNVQERPETRMAAFSMIMYTIPQKHILDQLTYTLFTERSQHVRSFVYTTLRAYSQSSVEVERELAKHLQAVIKMANVNEDELRMSRFHRIPIYSQEQREGLLLNLATGFASSNMIPQQVSLSMDSLFNGLLEQKNLELTLTQTNLEQFFNKLWEQYYSSRSTLRSNRRASEENGRGLIDDVYSTLNIKRGDRSSGFGMISLRIRDIDYVILPLSEESMPEMLQDLSLAKVIESIRERKSFRVNTLASLHERVMKIATTAGLPLRMSHAMPIVASAEGHFHVSHEDGKVQANLKLKPLLSGVHTQKMEMWSPLVNTGVEVLHNLALNLPLKMKLQTSMNSEEQIKLIMDIPTEKTRLVDISSLPLTFTRDFNAKSQLHGESLIKTIRNHIMENRFVEINNKENEERSLSVNGYYHTPSAMTYQHIFSIFTVTENHVTVEFTPMEETPKSVELTLKGKLFQETEKSSHRPEYRSFFESNTKKSNNDDEEESRENNMDNNDMEYETESDSTRRSSFNKYISEGYRANKVYQHNVQALIQTIGGSKQFKTEFGLKATCDSHMTLCKLSTDIKCSPMQNGEWTLKAKSQILAPEYVKNVEQLKENKQNKLAVTLECEWGSDKKQRVNLRVEGERAVPQKWTEQRWQRVLATAFINKYQVVADYKINHQSQYWVNRIWNMFKGYNFWNIATERMTENKEREVVATIMIDPMTRKSVNMTVRTPRETLRLTNVVLPMTVKPFALIRPQEKSFEMHSTSDIFNRVSESQRAECRADGRKIKTFDSVVYKAPIGKCYSVIAKDCVDKTFVVLMKTIDQESMQKKIKIVNNRDVIEIEPKDDELKVKVNGQQVEKAEELAENGINYDHELVRVNLPQGVTVRFDGKQATVKLSKYYQNSQCGLCGQWNDEESDEFRKGDDTETDDIKDFHRSYSGLKGDEECEDREQKKMYNDDSLFGKQGQQQMSRSNMDDNEDDRDDDFENDDDIDSYRHFDRKTDRKGDRQDDREDREDREDDDEEIRPVMRTQTMEYNHKLCFSLKAVKQCPRGSYADKTEQIKVPFTCLNRSSPQTRRLLRQTRNQDMTSELGSHKPSFVETVRVPISCQ